MHCAVERFKITLMALVDVKIVLEADGGVNLQCLAAASVAVGREG